VIVWLVTRVHSFAIEWRFGMAFHAGHVVDNRDAQEMFGYLEARVETMKRRIKELERENELLRSMQYVDEECTLG
jgi:cell division protein FtsB